jgi:FAD dependent oxidoreductase TIGR03364
MPQQRKRHYDLVIVGAGILGLAHALIAGRRGLKTAVFERDEEPSGASARNFGMLWPIGQRPGKVLNRALRSMEIWRDLFDEAGVWNDPCGSLLLARHEDELRTLQEFLEISAETGHDCRWLSPAKIAEKAPGVRQEGLLGALHSRRETLIQPRQALARLISFLRERFDTSFHFKTEVNNVEPPLIETTRGRFHADRVLICSGTDFETLFPEAFRESGTLRCSLQMMKTSAQPSPWKLGAMVTDSLTYRRYQAFKNSPSHAAMEKRVLAEHGDLERLGITVLAAQNNEAELIIGDSHHTAWSLPEAHDPTIDEKILSHLRDMIDAPHLEIARRWSAAYPVHAELTEVVLEPAANTRIVLASRGNGMTTSFALAEEVLEATG